MARLTVRRGFTLVELMAVIAIIAVLAAILFSALGEVKKQGKGTVEVSNMHQVFIALTLYEGDHNEWDPRYLTELGGYLKNSEVFSSPLDVYRKPELDGTWVEELFTPCDGGTSPIKVSYAYIRTFFDADTTKPEELLASVRGDSNVGIIASPWLGVPKQFPPSKAAWCGQSAADLLGPIMVGTNQRIDMDGSLYTFPGGKGCYGGCYTSLFLSRN
jgi:prepilin-type N-terminal cleavage/methylation domain-containing protein